VGQVSGVVKRTAGIFQEVTVMPYADFETLEEVLVIMNPPTSEGIEAP
jgi:cell shape-determining protein MreC